MIGHSAVWQESNDAQQQYYHALEQQQHLQERYLPLGKRRTPHTTVELPDPLTLKVIGVLSTVDRLVRETRQRYARAINSIHAKD